MAVPILESKEAFNYLQQWHHALGPNSYFYRLGKELAPHSSRQSMVLHPVSYTGLLAAVVHAFEPEPEGKFGERVKRVVSGKRFLELGARHGVFVDFLSQHGANSQGIDSNPEAVAVAQRHQVNVIENDAEHLREWGERDCIVAHQFFDPSYSAWWDKRKTARSLTIISDHIAKALRPGGFFVSVDLGNESLLDRKHLTDSGLRIEEYGSGGIPAAHLIIAQKPVKL